jgi:hypothetical protein
MSRHVKGSQLHLFSYALVPCHFLHDSYNKALWGSPTDSDPEAEYQPLPAIEWVTSLALPHATPGRWRISR